VDRVLGERTEITYADIGELKYCSSVFKETLRLWPPGPIIDRLTTKPTRMGNYDVPENTWVFVSLHVLISKLH
jgi:cytochrome P450